MLLAGLPSVLGRGDVMGVGDSYGGHERQTVVVVVLVATKAVASVGRGWVQWRRCLVWWCRELGSSKTCVAIGIFLLCQRANKDDIP